MTDLEVGRFQLAAGDPLIWRLATDDRIPLTLAEAAQAPVSILLQAEVMLDYADRIKPIIKARQEHAAKVAEAARRRRR